MEKRIPHHHPNRRDVLRCAAGGFGSIALNACSPSWPRPAREPASPSSADPLAPDPLTSAPKATRVIFLLHDRGRVACRLRSTPSRSCSPARARRCGSITSRASRATSRCYLKSPQFAFRPGGACGTEVSDLFPHMRSVVDDLCVIRSMSSDHTNHYEGTLGMHTGSFTFARPSIGAVGQLRAGHGEPQLPLVRRGGSAAHRMPEPRPGAPTSCRAATRGRTSCPARRRSRTSAAGSAPTRSSSSSSR